MYAMLPPSNKSLRPDIPDKIPNDCKFSHEVRPYGILIAKVNTLERIYGGNPASGEVQYPSAKTRRAEEFFHLR
jgi:hypothetical protein